MSNVFDTIEYLRNGNQRQKQAFAVLTRHEIMDKLKPFDPILVGTIPINVDIEGSDLDIICCFSDKLQFKNTLVENFSGEENFGCKEIQISNTTSVVAKFVLDHFTIEIFGQALPTRQQVAYRHMIVEHQILLKYGEGLRQKIIALKQEGYKTEPAFAIALGISGDPYIELLKQ